MWGVEQAVLRPWLGSGPPAVSPGPISLEVRVGVGEGRLQGWHSAECWGHNREVGCQGSRRLRTDSPGPGLAYLVGLPDPQCQRPEEDLPLFGLRPAFASPDFLHPHCPTELTRWASIFSEKPCSHPQEHGLSLVTWIRQAKMSRPCMKWIPS